MSRYLNKAKLIKTYNGTFTSGILIDSNPAISYLKNDRLYIVVLGSSNVTGASLLTPIYINDAWRATVAHGSNPYVVNVAFDRNGFIIWGVTNSINTIYIYEITTNN